MISLELRIVLKEYFLSPVRAVNKRGQISPKNRLLVYGEINKVEHIFLVSNSNATNSELLVPLNKSFELEMRDERNMTKFNSLGPK